MDEQVQAHFPENDVPQALSLNALYVGPFGQVAFAELRQSGPVTLPLISSIKTTEAGILIVFIPQNQVTTVIRFIYSILQ